MGWANYFNGKNVLASRLLGLGGGLGYDLGKGTGNLSTGTKLIGLGLYMGLGKTLLVVIPWFLLLTSSSCNLANPKIAKSDKAETLLP